MDLLPRSHNTTNNTTNFEKFNRLKISMSDILVLARLYASPQIQKLHPSALFPFLNSAKQNYEIRHWALQTMCRRPLKNITTG